MKAPLRQRLRDLFNRLEAMPMNELTRGQRFIRFLWQLWVTAYQQLRQDRAGSNAAALTFRTLFSLLPILVLTAVVTRYFISDETFMNSIDEVMNWLHMDEVGMAAADGAEAGSIDLEEWVSDRAREAMSVDLTGLTWLGIIIVLYAAVRLIEEVDTTFNFITRSTPGGWIRKRIWVYLGVLLLAPAAVIAAGWFLERGVHELGELVGTWPWVVPTVQTCITLVLLWWLLRLCYRAIPAREIRPRPASLGAASATILLVIGQWLLVFYVDQAVRSSPLGGSLGFVPVFMFWVYMMWLSVLYGLEITMVAQQLGDLRSKEAGAVEEADPAG